MTTIQKLERLLKERYAAVTRETHGFHIEWGATHVHADTLDEAVNEAYAAAFPKIEAKPGDLVEIVTGSYDSRKWVKVDDDGAFVDVTGHRYSSATWKVKRIIVRGPLPEPIPLESAE